MTTTTQQNDQIDQIIDELHDQAMAANKTIDLASGYEWVKKRLHRFKDIVETCEYYLDTID